MSARSWACRLPLRSQKGQLHVTSLTFLGIMLDYSNYDCPQPSCKKSPFSPNLGWRSVTKRELLSLIGKLSFAAKSVPAGRLFLRHLIHLSTTARRLHHRLHLNANARADVEWLNHFLPSWNGMAMFIAPDCHPPLHGCFKYTGIWGLLEWGLDQGQRAATPATAWMVNSVTTAVCHIGSGPHVGDISYPGNAFGSTATVLQLSRHELTSHPNTSGSWSY